MTLPEGAVLRDPTSWRLSAEPQKRTRHGRLLGRPRADQQVLRVLSSVEWTPMRLVAERLGKSKQSTQQALYRAHVRGLIELQRGQGWRIRRAS